MKRASMIASGAMLAMFLFAAIFIIATASAQTEPPSTVPTPSIETTPPPAPKPSTEPAPPPPPTPIAVPGAKFEVSYSMTENLKIYIGKEVLIHLRSGKTLKGYVKAVGDQVVHLEKLAERDFYDALIRIDDISAIGVKFRDIK